MSEVDGKPPARTGAAGPGRDTAEGSQTKRNSEKSTTRERRHNRWRERMPDSADYYRQALGQLRESTDGWCTARCRFHEDRVQSLSVHLGHGGWKCHAGCGSGDMVSFEMRLRECDFKTAILALTGVRL